MELTLDQKNCLHWIFNCGYYDGGQYKIFPIDKVNSFFDFEEDVFLSLIAMDLLRYAYKDGKMLGVYVSELGEEVLFREASEEMKRVDPDDWKENSPIENVLRLYEGFTE